MQSAVLSVHIPEKLLFKIFALATYSISCNTGLSLPVRVHNMFPSHFSLFSFLPYTKLALSCPYPFLLPLNPDICCPSILFQGSSGRVSEMSEEWETSELQERAANLCPPCPWLAGCPGRVFLQDNTWLHIDMTHLFGAFPSFHIS